MTDYSSLPLDQLLKGFVCPSCGKKHESQLKVYRAGAGVVREVPDVLRELGAKKPFVVYDANTYKAAGETVLRLLNEAGIAYSDFCFPWEHVEPDEQSVGALTMAFDPSCDIILAVGSGVINDVCKVAARAMRIPSMVVGTAPSMDGYASDSSSMHVNDVKTTLYNACPVAILCDTDIVSQAPMRMLWSGLGDMIAKYVSILEWRVANLVIDEEYCETIAQLVRRSLKKCVDNADKLANRDPEAVKDVFEGLVLSGVAMAFAKSSRPASGGEHYFSHMWEMMAMERHTKADFHGIQVGVGTLLSLKLYDWVRTLKPDQKSADEAMDAFDPTAWEAEVKRIFGATAPQILEIERKFGKNERGGRDQRLARILNGWDSVLRYIEEELPPTERIAGLMKGLGMPMTPSDLGISTQDAQDAFIGSREIRNKYILASLLWDIGKMEEAKARVSAD